MHDSANASCAHALSMLVDASVEPDNKAKPMTGIERDLQDSSFTPTLLDLITPRACSITDPCLHGNPPLFGMSATKDRKYRKADGPTDRLLQLCEQGDGRRG
jgi:hypothetical protein